MGATLQRKRRRLSPQERQEIELESLSRARSGSMANFVQVILDFEARGITDIRPKENVFTYHAWRALGRQVRKGEKGVKITSWCPIEGKEIDPKTGEKTKRLRPVTAVVFHVSQTDAVQGGAA